jgi:hypothetical protein
VFTYFYEQAEERNGVERYLHAQIAEQFVGRGGLSPITDQIKKTVLGRSFLFGTPYRPVVESD